MLLGGCVELAHPPLPRLTMRYGIPPCSVRMKPSMPSPPPSSVNSHSLTSTSESAPPALSLPAAISLQTPEHHWLGDIINYSSAKQRAFPLHQNKRFLEVTISWQASIWRKKVNTSVLQDLVSLKQNFPDRTCAMV